MIAGSNPTQDKKNVFFDTSTSLYFVRLIALSYYICSPWKRNSIVIGIINVSAYGFMT